MFQAIFQFSVNSQQERRKALKINNCVEDKKISLKYNKFHFHRQEISISNTKRNKLTPFKNV